MIQDCYISKYMKEDMRKDYHQVLFCFSTSHSIYTLLKHEIKHQVVMFDFVNRITCRMLGEI